MFKLIACNLQGFLVNHLQPCKLHVISLNVLCFKKSGFKMPLIFAVQQHYSNVHVAQLLNASSGCRSQFLSLFLHLLCRTAIGSIYSLIVLLRLCAHFGTHLWPLMPFLTQLWPKYVMHKYQCIIHTLNRIMYIFTNWYLLQKRFLFYLKPLHNLLISYLDQ